MSVWGDMLDEAKEALSQEEAAHLLSVQATLGTLTDQEQLERFHGYIREWGMDAEAITRWSRHELEEAT